jgi:hypothetical protein
LSFIFCGNRAGPTGLPEQKIMKNQDNPQPFNQFFQDGTKVDNKEDKEPLHLNIP